MYSYDNIIVFLEKFNALNKRNKYFVFGNKSTQIINPTEENLKMMQLFENIDMHDILKLVYKRKEFIDTEKLHALNVFYRDIKEVKRTIDILTFRKNRK